MGNHGQLTNCATRAIPLKRSSNTFYIRHTKHESWAECCCGDPSKKKIKIRTGKADGNLIAATNGSRECCRRSVWWLIFESSLSILRFSFEYQDECGDESQSLKNSDDDGSNGYCVHVSLHEIICRILACCWSANKTVGRGVRARSVQLSNAIRPSLPTAAVHIVLESNTVTNS